MSPSEKLRNKAHEALIAFFAYLIRNEVGEDPDHSGPEDAADALAEKLLNEGSRQVLDADWKDLLE